MNVPRFSTLEQHLELNERVKSIEAWRSLQDIETVRMQERRANQDERFDRVEARLDRIDAHIGKVVWLLVISILSAFMTFVIRGGLV